MLEQDYIVRLFVRFAEAVRRSMQKASGQRDPLAAADLIEAAIGEATELDGAVFLSLAPESIASILQVSGTDPRVVEYIARSLLLESTYLMEAGIPDTAALRAQQAHALATGFGIDLNEEMLSAEEFEELFERTSPK